MSVEGRGWVTRVGIDLANWQQEEPADFGGRRQLSMAGTSRISREAQVRICSRLGVRFPGGDSASMLASNPGQPGFGTEQSRLSVENSEFLQILSDFLSFSALI